MPESKPIPVEILVGGSYTEPVHIELTRTRTPKVARRRKVVIGDREDENCTTMQDLIDISDDRT